MLLSELFTAIRHDMADLDASRFTDALLRRFIERALVRLNRDLTRCWFLAEEQIQPDMTEQQRDLLLLLGQIHACQYMRVAKADGFSFQSGDKRVDQTDSPRRWSELEADLWARYREALQMLNIQASSDDILPVTSVGAIFDQGICLDYGFVDPDREKLRGCGL